MADSADGCSPSMLSMRPPAKPAVLLPTLSPSGPVILQGQHADADDSQKRRGWGSRRQEHLLPHSAAGSPQGSRSVPSSRRKAGLPSVPVYQTMQPGRVCQVALLGTPPKHLTFWHWHWRDGQLLKDGTTAGEAEGAGGDLASRALSHHASEPALQLPILRKDGGEGPLGSSTAFSMSMSPTGREGSPVMALPELPSPDDLAQVRTRKQQAGRSRKKASVVAAAATTFPPKDPIALEEKRQARRAARAAATATLSDAGAGAAFGGMGGGGSSSTATLASSPAPSPGVTTSDRWSKPKPGRHQTQELSRRASRVPPAAEQQQQQNQHRQQPRRRSTQRVLPPLEARVQQDPSEDADHGSSVVSPYEEWEVVDERRASAEWGQQVLANLQKQREGKREVSTTWSPEEIKEQLRRESEAVWRGESSPLPRKSTEKWGLTTLPVQLGTGEEAPGIAPAASEEQGQEQDGMHSTSSDRAASSDPREVSQADGTGAASIDIVSAVGGNAVGSTSAANAAEEERQASKVDKAAVAAETPLPGSQAAADTPATPAQTHSLDQALPSALPSLQGEEAPAGTSQTGGEAPTAASEERVDESQLQKTAEAESSEEPMLTVRSSKAPSEAGSTASRRRRGLTHLLGEDIEEGRTSDGESSSDDELGGAFSPKPSCQARAPSVLPYETVDNNMIEDAFNKLRGMATIEILVELIPAALQQMGYRHIKQGILDEIIESVAGESSFVYLKQFLQIVHKYNKRRLKQLYQEFVDVEGNGRSRLSIDALRGVMALHSATSTPCMLRALLKEIHTGQPVEQATAHDYVQLRGIFQYRGGFTAVESDEMRVLFNRYDDDGSGYMDKQELASALRWLGLHLQDDAQGEGPNLTQLLEGMDLKEDGALSFEDFLEVMGHHRDAELEWAQQLFEEQMSTEADGSIDLQGACTVLVQLGFTSCTSELIQETCEETNSGHGDPLLLSFDDFYMLLRLIRQREGFSQTEVEEFQKAYEAHDTNDSNGVDVVELGGVLRWCGYPCTIEDQQDFMDAVDVDKSGEIDFDEFLKIMRWYKEKEFKQLQRAFVAGDLDGSGTLDRKEIRKLLPSLGYYTLLPEQKALVEQFQAAGELDFHECRKMIEGLRTINRNNFRERHGFVEADLMQLKKKFERTDADNSGEIAKNEIAHLLEECIPESAKTQEGREYARTLLKKVDRDGDGSLSWVEFLHLMRLVQDRADYGAVLKEQEAAARAGFSHDEVKDLRKAFKICDSDASRSLDVDEVIQMLTRLVPMSRKVGDKVRDIVQELDEDNSATLDFSEFLAVMRRVQDENIVEVSA